MAEAALTEAPLKRKLEVPSEFSDCKKPRDSLSLKDPTEIDGHLAQSDGNVACNGELKLSKSAEPSEEGETKTTELDENVLKGDGKLTENCDPISVEASGSGSAGLEESEALGEGEVLEAALVQDDDDDDDEQGDEEQMSEIDTENNSVDEEEDEDAGSDEDEDEDEDEDDSDDEEDEEEMPMSTSSSLQAPKGKGIEEGKGKEKVIDVKGKGIMLADKGKGKAIVEDEPAPGSDEDDAGYLSEDPLDEVDLNNILPTRTRRRSSSTHYDFVAQGDEEDDDDDDSDA